MDDEERRARSNAASKRWYQRNREQEQARRRAYYLANREEIRERSRSERVREQQRAGSRRYRERNPEKMRERARQYRLANREEILEKNRVKRREEYRADPQAALAKTMLSHHGMYPEDWAAMWQAQDGRCYLCGEPMDDLGARQIHIEHDHSCCQNWRSCRVCRRGLACHNCNTLIGLAGDDVARLRRIADALETAQAGVSQRMSHAAVSKQQLALEELPA